jgi:hypothetical protein
MKMIAPRIGRPSWKTASALALAIVALSGRPASASVLSIPTNLTVAPGATVTVPVMLAVAPGFNLTGFTIDIQFDPNLFTFAGGVTQGNLLTDSFNPSANVIGGNVIRINGFDQTNFSQALANGASGTLFSFNLTAKATDTPGTTSPVTPLATPGTGVFNDSGADQTAGQKLPGLITIAGVPEPSQVVLLGALAGLGLGKLAWERRRRSGDEA